MAEERTLRRLAAIVAADVAGYSRLMQLDEAGTLAALKTRRSEVLQPLVSKYHGRIVKLMGDGVLIEFASAGSKFTDVCVLTGVTDPGTQTDRLPPVALLLSSEFRSAPSRAD